jgi:hypothetical protein
MSVTERLQQEALAKLNEAREAALNFLDCAEGDWKLPSEVFIRESFTDIRQDLREFGRWIGIKS